MADPIEEAPRVAGDGGDVVAADEGVARVDERVEAVRTLLPAPDKVDEVLALARGAAGNMAALLEGYAAAGAIEERLRREYCDELFREVNAFVAQLSEPLRRFLGTGEVIDRPGIPSSVSFSCTGNNVIDGRFSAAEITELTDIKVTDEEMTSGLFSKPAGKNKRASVSIAAFLRFHRELREAAVTKRGFKLHIIIPPDDDFFRAIFEANSSPAEK